MKIAHISDLHFGGHDGIDSRFDALSRSVAMQEPEVLVVAGDLFDTPSGELASRARDKILDLCKACKLEPASALFTIPGNHDVWYHGIGWGDRRVFDECFDSWNRNLRVRGKDGVTVDVLVLDSCPPRRWWRMLWSLFSVFGLPISGGFHVKELVLWVSAGVLGGLAWLFCTNRTFLPPLPLVLGLMAGLGVLPAVYFASKDRWMIMQEHLDETLEHLATALALARGRVSRKDLRRGLSWLEEIRGGGEAQVTVAVVHHHVLTNADAPGSPAMDSFGLALDNAGVVLGVLQGARVNLILQGHRHTPFVAGAPTCYPSVGRMRMHVLSCGTSSHTNPRERPTGLNEYKLIDVKPDGSILVQSFVCREGQDDFSAAGTDTQPPLRTTSDFVQESIARLLASPRSIGQPERVSSATRSVVVTKWGDAEVTVVLQVSTPVATGAHDLRLPMGSRLGGHRAPPHGVIRYDWNRSKCEAKSGRSVIMIPEIAEEPAGETLLGALVVKDLKSADYPITIEYSYRVFNAYARTHEELGRLYLPGVEEECSDTSTPWVVDALRIEIAFDRDYLNRGEGILQSLKMTVHPLPPSCGPSSRILGEEERLRESHDFIERGCRWTVDKPCPDWHYRVSWKPPKATVRPVAISDEEWTRIRSRQNLLTDRFAAIGPKAEGPAASVRTSVRKAMVNAHEIVKRALAKDDVLEIVLLAFDRTRPGGRKIIPVLALAPDCPGYPSPYEGEIYAKLDLGWGQGNAGAAFLENGRVAFCSQFDTLQSQFKGGGFRGLNGLVVPDLCIATGIWYPEGHGPVPLAALSIASRVGGSQLYKVWEYWEEPAEEWPDEIKDVVGPIKVSVDSLSKTILDIVDQWA